MGPRNCPAIKKKQLFFLGFFLLFIYVMSHVYNTNPRLPELGFSGRNCYIQSLEHAENYGVHKTNDIFYFIFFFFVIRACCINR